MTSFLILVWGRSVGLALLTVLALAVARRTSASVRHAIGTAGLLAIFLSPAMSLLLPQRKIEALPSVDVQILSRSKPLGRVASPEVTPLNNPEPSMFDPTELLGYVWALGTLWLFARLGFGFAAMKSLVKHSRPTELGSNDYEVREAARVGVPMVVWDRRPIILIGSDHIGWSPSRLKGILAHESAHISRGDLIIQTIASIACALLWPNPLLWLIRVRLRRLAEQAADDIVLSQGAVPTDYAQSLIDVARLDNRRTPVLAVPLTTKPDISRRIEMILRPSLARNPISTTGRMLLAVVGVLVSAPLSAYSFQAASQVPKSGSQDATTSTPLVISCTLVRPSEALEKELDDDAPTPKESKSAGVTIPNEVADRFLKHAKASHSVRSAPIIRDLSGLPASLTSRVAGVAETINVTPTQLADHTVKVEIQYSQSYESEGSGTVQKATTTLPTNSTLVLRMRSAGGFRNPTILLLKVDVPSE